jgi:hypothetical protein
LSDQVNTAEPGENPGKVVVACAIDFDVEILGLKAEQGIAHGAADNHGSKAGAMKRADDLFERQRKGEEHVGSRL